MRLHLGHHFYGAGNLGDDFMLAGFLLAMKSARKPVSYTLATPFRSGIQAHRFPEIAWLAYDDEHRERAIAECDVWVGIGGAPFQSAQSRWFIEHLLRECEWCRRYNKPMYYVGVGVQSAVELAHPEVRELISQATAIWARDDATCERLQDAHRVTHAGADLAHVLFATFPPPPLMPGRLSLVVNFDYGHWSGQERWLSALNELPATERIWLVQESRELPGAEKSIYNALPPTARVRWQLNEPENGAALAEVIGRWPTTEWMVTARHHAAIAAAWAGTKITVLATNEKLIATANDLGVPAVSPTASTDEIRAKLNRHDPATHPRRHAIAAEKMCAEFRHAVGLV